MSLNSTGSPGGADSKYDVGTPAASQLVPEFKFHTFVKATTLFVPVQTIPGDPTTVT